MFWKLDMFPSGDGGDIYSDRSLRNVRCIILPHNTCPVFSSYKEIMKDVICHLR
jgi:hypothetical protein